MNFIQKIYLSVGLTAFVISLCLLFLDKKSFYLLTKEYLFFLGKPWKCVTMLLATVFVTFVGPYSGDYTWDYVDGFVMSVMTCFTAPWAIGTFFQFRDKIANLKQIFVAFCLWMFTISWFFELYIFLRDGQYPTVWLPNIVLSSILYWCAGLLWNLDWTSSKGVYFSFEQKTGWLNLSSGPVFWKILRKGWIYIAVVSILFGEVIYALNHNGQFFP